MILLRFPHRSNPTVDAFFAIVILVLIGVAILTSKLTRGFVVGYLRKDIPFGLKWTMFWFHTIVPLLSAFILPNNYLVDMEFFRELYKRNELWIAASMLGLLFISFLMIGSLFSLLTWKRGKKNDFIR